jgi:hypothetical protein
VEGCLRWHGGLKPIDGDWDGKNQQEVYAAQCDEEFWAYFMGTYRWVVPLDSYSYKESQKLGNYWLGQV